MGNIGSRKGEQLPDMKLKMALIGAGGSGKTSVFTRITANQFNYHYTPTSSVSIGSIVKKINVPVDCLVSLSLWDLPGIEDMDMRQSYYKDLDAAVIVVNISHTDSINEVLDLKSSLMELTKTASEMATFELVADTDKEDEKEAAEEAGEGEDQEPRQQLVDIPVLILGSKVDELVIEADQDDLHPNVKLLGGICDEAKCTGWVPVSAKENDRSIDLAFTSFLRYIVEKKLKLEQAAGTIKGGLSHVTTSKPTFIPPSTAATRIRDREQEAEDENEKRLPLINHEPVDTEYKVIRKLIGKIRRGHKDWKIAYRRFRKAVCQYGIAPNTSCSIEELILNLKEKLPVTCLKAVEFHGWIKLEIDEESVDIDDVDEQVLEVVDSFNYELFPNAAFVETTLRNAMMTIMECKEKLSLLQIPVSLSDQVRENNKEIKSLLEMCQTATSEVDDIRKCIEVALMW